MNAPTRDKLELWGGRLYIAVSIVLCLACWCLVSQLKAAQLQPIASAISTFAGIMFGFVMASITLLASAKDNTLIKNTQKTGYLKNLVDQLHKTMGWLLFVCVIFLVVMFLPDSLSFKHPALWGRTETLYSSIVLQLGVFILLISFKNFYLTWRQFKEFTKLM